MANKAPDKIYMPNELLSEEWCRHIEGQDTEYIRKDALLEWLNEKLPPQQWINKYGDGGEVVIGLQVVIDKINSM